MTNEVVEKDVQRAVDRLLLEQGIYTPLEFLLAEGRLLYSDYESWRTQGGFLEERLFGNPEPSCALLQQGAAYAKALGLEAESFGYARWGGCEGQELRFSPDSVLDRLFHIRYGTPADAIQLDLLMDATGIALVNGITATLKERNYDEARRLLARLADADPSNNRIGDLQLLAGASESLHLLVDDLAAELDYLQQVLAPLASDYLGAGSRDFLMPFWQKLLNALRDKPFDPDHPKLHSSYLATRMEAWIQVQRSIESEAEWSGEPLLLRRYAQASGRLHQNELAASYWFRLCWRFPSHADAIGTDSESIWRNRWQRFMVLEPELERKDFPAWTLLEQPGYVLTLTDAACMIEAAAPEDYLVTAGLVTAGAAAVPSADLIEQRRWLKELNPNLFVHYLERFGRE